MKPQALEARYQLTLLSYPDEFVIPRLCRLLYDSQDKNLIASLSSLPYSIGRSFLSDEAEKLHQALIRLEVAHAFKSASTDLPPLEYLPRNDVATTSSPLTAESLAPSRSANLKTVYLKIILASAIGILFLIGMYFLKQSLTPSGEIHKNVTSVTDYEAKVISLANRVEWKKARDLEWQDATPAIVLQALDSIRTHQNAHATLQYRDGGSLLVRSDTLLVIGRKNSASTQTIQLTDGSLQARIGKGTTLQKLEINTPLGMIQIKGSDGTSSPTRVDTTIRGNQMKVGVLGGAATLHRATKGEALGEGVVIGANQEIEASKDSISAPKPYRPSLVQYLPMDKARIEIGGASPTPIVFQWEDLGAQVDYHLQVSGDTEFKHIFLDQLVTEPEARLTYLDPGSLYWRVTARIDDIDFQSETRQLYVVQKSTD